MKFGLYLPNFGEFADVRVIAEVARAAEDAGFDGCFVWDHLSPVFAPGMLVPTADVTVAQTAIALATSRIRFGAVVTPLARRRVQKVARELASLDRLSDGRLVLGVGLGEPAEHEYVAFGEPASNRERAQRLDESLAVLMEIWKGGPIDFDGEQLHVHSVPLLPTPRQQPRIPVWVAMRWPTRSATLMRRAMRFDGVFPISPNVGTEFLTPDDIRAVRDAIGRDDVDVITDPGPDAAPAEEFAAAGLTWLLDSSFTREDALKRIAQGP